MRVELPAQVEEELHDLAVQQGRGVEQVVEEAVRQYLEAAAITDLSADDVAATQVALVGEMREISSWEG